MSNINVTNKNFIPEDLTKSAKTMQGTFFTGKIFIEHDK